MLTCPHCGKPGISAMRKLFLGPAVPATCKTCGKKVGVSYSSIFAGIPVVAAIIVSGFVEPFAIKAVLWVGGFVVSAICHMCWARLEPR